VEVIDIVITIVFIIRIDQWVKIIAAKLEPTFGLDFTFQIIAN